MAEDQNRTLTDKFMLRLPDGMRDRIKAAAVENKRSMNAEIVATLEDKYPAPRGRDLTALFQDFFDNNTDFSDEACVAFHDRVYPTFTFLTPREQKIEVVRSMIEQVQSAKDRLMEGR